jgi:hypothetical protein
MIQNPNLKPSQRFALLGVVDPDAYASGADYSTGWVNAGLYESLCAIILAGTIVSTGKLDAKLEQATSSAGAGAKDVTGKAITQLLESGTDSDKQAIINLKSEELDTNNGFAWVRLTLTSTTAGADAAGLLLGFDARYPPAHAATVDEVVG